MTYTFSIQNDFPNHKVAPTKFLSEIQASAITVAISEITTDGDNCNCPFKATLSAGEITILGGIVAVHDGEEAPDTSPKMDSQNRLIVQAEPTFANYHGAIFRSISNTGIIIGGTTSDVCVEVPDDCVLFGGSYELYGVPVGCSIVNGVLQKGDYISCGLYFCPAGYPGVEILQGNEFIITEYILPKGNTPVERQRPIDTGEAGLTINPPPSQYGVLKLCAYYHTVGQPTTNDIELIIRFNLWKIPT